MVNASLYEHLFIKKKIALAELLERHYFFSYRDFEAPKHLRPGANVQSVCLLMMLVKLTVVLI